MYQTYNGRIDSLNKETQQFNLHPSELHQHFTLQNDAIRGSVTRNPVSDLFFSQHNIDILQEGIRYSVYTKTGKVIGRQSDKELSVIMRSIYMQDSKNLPHQVIEQVRELNSKVLTYCVSQIVSEVSMYMSYLKDITSLPKPLPHSINTSMRGTKVSELTEL